MVRLLYFVSFFILASVVSEIYSQDVTDAVKTQEPYSYGMKYNELATYYSNWFEGRLTTTEEVFDQTKYTAAHKYIPLNTLVRVTNKKNNRSVVVRVNDRCPKHRVIDLSLIAAKRLDMLYDGVVSVRIEILNDDYLDIWSKQDDMFKAFDREKEKKK